MMWAAVVIFHVANAWQESPDTIKLFACCFKEVGPAAFPVSYRNVIFHGHIISILHGLSSMKASG